MQSYKYISGKNLIKYEQGLMNFYDWLIDQLRLLYIDASSHKTDAIS